MRILAVDDDYVSLSKLQVILSKYGDCDIAKDGFTAVRMFKKAHEEAKPYDLMTLDIEMPVMSGLVVIQKCREWEKKIVKSGKKINKTKILMISIKDSMKDISSSFKEGCEWYLAKPVTPENIRDALLEMDVLMDLTRD